MAIVDMKKLGKKDLQQLMDIASASHVKILTGFNTASAIFGEWKIGINLQS